MSPVVNLWVSSPDTHSERRFDPHLTIDQLKGRLEVITGIPVTNQIVTLLNSPEDNQVIAELSDGTKQLGFYGVRDWQVLKVADSNPSATFTGQLTDVSQVDKFEITDEEYAKRQDTVLAYKQRHQMGRFAPQAKTDEEIASEVAKAAVAGIPIGSRCEVESSDPGLRKRGTVRFVGETSFGKGVWVGVEYDEPFGKNNGSVQGVKYFECRSNYGVFVKPEKVEIGNFPVEELTFDDEEI